VSWGTPRGKRERKTTKGRKIKGAHDYTEERHVHIKIYTYHEGERREGGHAGRAKKLQKAQNWAPDPSWKGSKPGRGK